MLPRRSWSQKKAAGEPEVHPTPSSHPMKLHPSCSLPVVVLRPGFEEQGALPTHLLLREC